MYTIKLERGGLGIAKRGDGSSICKGNCSKCVHEIK